jgi:hypothetical protein
MVWEDDEDIMIYRSDERHFLRGKEQVKKRMNYMNWGRVKQVVKYIYYSK